MAPDPLGGAPPCQLAPSTISPELAGSQVNVPARAGRTDDVRTAAAAKLANANAHRGRA